MSQLIILVITYDTNSWFLLFSFLWVYMGLFKCEIWLKHLPQSLHLYVFHECGYSCVLLIWEGYFNGFRCSFKHSYTFNLVWLNICLCNCPFSAKHTLHLSQPNHFSLVCFPLCSFNDDYGWNICHTHHICMVYLLCVFSYALASFHSQQNICHTHHICMVYLLCVFSYVLASFTFCSKTFATLITSVWFISCVFSYALASFHSQQNICHTHHICMVYFLCVMCICNFEFSTKRLSHLLQWYLFSPVCVLACLF